jgi:hypothetical protein
MLVQYMHVIFTGDFGELALNSKNDCLILLQYKCVHNFAVLR